MNFRFPLGLPYFETSILQPSLLADGVVYCLVDAHGGIVYVGITGRGEARFDRHHRVDDAVNKYGAVKLWYHVEPSLQRRRSLETIILSEYDPVANREASPSNQRLTNALLELEPRLGSVPNPRQRPRNALLASELPKRHPVPPVNVFANALALQKKR